MTSDRETQLSPSDDLDLSELWFALIRRRRIAIAVGGSLFLLVTTFLVFTRIFKPVYQGSFSLLIRDPMSSSSDATPEAIKGTAMFENLAINSSRYDVPSLIELLKSNLLIKSVAKKYNLSPNQLSNDIDISLVTSKKRKLRRFQVAEAVLNVKLVSNKPRQLTNLLGDLSKAYLQASLNQRQQKLNDGLNFLNNQEPILQDKVSVLQNQIVEFREKYKILNPLLEGESLSKRKISLLDRQMALENERKVLINVKQEISDGRLSSIGFNKLISSSANEGDNGLVISNVDQTLIKEYLSLETELSKARLKYTDESKIIKSLNSKIIKIKPFVIEHQIESVVTALKLNSNQLKNINEEINSLNKKFILQPELIKRYNILQQKLSIANNNLIGLVSARENFLLKLAQNSLPWKVIEPPRMQSSPIKPSIPKGIIFAFLLGSAAGISSAFVRDRFDRAIYSNEELRELLNLPILGNIPYIMDLESKKDKFVNFLNVINDKIESSSDESSKNRRLSRFFYQEAFRNLYTSIRFLSSDSPIKMITVTSSVPAEGKSLTNILLSKTLSELGNKVLLIDGDLRKPQIHKRLNLNNIRGLSNVLIDKKLSIDDVVQDVPNHTNWKILTAGISPPDPTRLLSSNRIKSLLNELSNSDQYDFIIIDTPPILGLSDAALLSEHTDGLILIASLSFVQKDLVQESVRRISSTKANLLGIISNSLSPKRFASNGYGYGYGYGYAPEEQISKYFVDDQPSISSNSNPIESKSKISRLSLIASTIKKYSLRVINWIENN